MRAIVFLIGLFVLVAIFGLILLADRRKTSRGITKEAATEEKITPEEMWQKHVEELREREKTEE